MNARDFNFPPLPAYTATWYALRFEPMRGTGESFTCAVLLKDSDGAEIRPVIRDDILTALFGDYAAHVQDMIATAMQSLLAFAETSDPANWSPPLTGFNLAEQRQGASQAARDGVFRQAVKLASAFSQLDFAPQESNEQPALEAARTFVLRIRQQVEQTHAELARYFDKPARIVTNGALIRFGFLMDARAAHFEVLRPATLSTSVRFARGKLYELKKARAVVPLDKSVLIVGIPHHDDLGFSDKQHAAIEREMLELKQEAAEDGTDVLPAVSDVNAADHVVALAT